ncbi:transporter [Dyella nitratireducens]|uniref:MetA-pathway of phenol degradation n=1 Tax=Dyella nitratireducens TaxID=1849580 RepID=A0ABQ1GHK1_9GAMM|nr:transporter [Dyella nitratireducens]GGA43804.1 hypothetical protein GCM10010981_36160 [Dyella nitratireducens]GLQ41827.1 hypothetical protein GCM10007902_16770 [Dyella nitratireducens]
MKRFGLKHTTFALLFASLGWCAQASAADSDVNFTGPLLTPSPNVPPQGTWMIEPYLMYYKSADAYDDQGNSQPKTNSVRQWQTLVPIFYSVTDRFMLTASVGAAHSMSGGMHTDGWGATDTTIGGQYQLLAHNEDRTSPALAVRYTHRFPTGAYDELNENPLNATGNGAHVDTFSLLAQQYAWLPNGRPLRFRASISYSLPPSRVDVKGTSAYGTPQDFRGGIRLGNSFGISTAVEYSINSKWALALDLAYNRTSASQLNGVRGEGENTSAFSRRDPLQNVYSLAPAVEYNFNDRFGLIAGVQFSFAGRNNDAFMTPMAAFNMVF